MRRPLTVPAAARAPAREPIAVRAPGKAILFGEHAINRGQPALAVSVGLYATCRIAPADRPGYRLQNGADAVEVSTGDLADLGRRVDAARAGADYDTLRQVAADFFGPAEYVLASALGVLEAGHPPGAGQDSTPGSGPDNGLDIAFSSEIPLACGLGSGGAAFAALASALAAWHGGRGEVAGPETRRRIAEWAHRGDVIAHGGTASRLDTQTSLCGGVIRFEAAAGLAEAIPYDPGLCLVIGNTNVYAATSEVNGRVRRWLDQSPVGRRRYFEAVGVLSRAALDPLRRGDWDELGSLLTLNHLLLEKIGVSCPELQRLVDAALAAGALGAKLAGSGGGGIIIALVRPEDRARVAGAIADAGGTAYTPALAVPGAHEVPA